MGSNRPDRVGEQIRVELTQLLARDVHDPGIGFITLTKVSVTADLQLARVYYTSFGDAHAQSETGKALRRALPFLRRQVAQRVRLRRVPELEFFYDASIARHDRIEHILLDLKAEAAARGESAAAIEPPAGSEEAGAADVMTPPGLTAETVSPREGAAATEPRERSGAAGVPASERVGGSGGATPPGQK